MVIELIGPHIVPLARKLFAGLTLVALSTACSTGPEYKPRLPGEAVGYTDLQLSPNRYRVSFSGSSASTRDDVEHYLLQRAAELTARGGHTHFVFSRRDTERNTSYVGNYPYGLYYHYYPYLSWYWGGPNGGDVWAVTRYAAFAEIVVLKAEDAVDNPEAIEALALLQRLPPPVSVASADPRRS
jgi:hypothetical protein